MIYLPWPNFPLGKDANSCTIDDTGQTRHKRHNGEKCDSTKEIQTHAHVYLLPPEKVSDWSAKNSNRLLACILYVCWTRDYCFYSCQSFGITGVTSMTQKLIKEKFT